MFEECESEIQKLEIPDDDLRNWVTALINGGLNYPDIDKMLIKLNSSYAKLDADKRAEMFVGQLEDFWERHGEDKISEEGEETLERMKQKVLGKLRK